MSLTKDNAQGGAIVEFALALPALVMVCAAIVTALSIATDQVRLQGAAATAARVIARGDAISGELQTELDYLGAMQVSIHSQYLVVELDRTRSLLGHSMNLHARAVARTEVSTNDFEQN